MSTYYMKTVIYTPTTNEKEFNDYIEHLKEEQHLKITIRENEKKILYMGEDPAGNKDLYAIKEVKNDSNTRKSMQYKLDI